MHHLENEYLRITVNTKGAELKSVFNKECEQELLWQANPEFWAKSSPVLFPIVGALKNDMYRYEGKEYQLPRHGFARDNYFKIDQITDTQLIFSLESSEETLKNYPFLFKLQIIYTLHGNGLKVGYNVENLSDEKTMYFSLGAHPAFNVGNSTNEFCTFSLNFNNDDCLSANVLNDGLLTAQQKVISLKNKHLPLNYKLFDEDALVLLNLKSDKIQLVDSDNVNRLTFKFVNFPQFGIWTVKDSDFVCLEPWAGVADFEHHDQKLVNKFGINKLLPKESWSASWTITV